ncbi:hypothetical protein L2E82_49691 [Cichorium intybus]|uniref:Uncharacterized protein n=1 Tax=Cichorium intybus TaxID=13427 RepID=A0ACB8Z0N8_CICIN|nr:hypothetical protein L2E82_49691 [Cichorium intybus]
MVYNSIMKCDLVFGSEDQSLDLSSPSNRCGFPRASMTSLVHLSSTGNASKKKGIHGHIWNSTKQEDKHHFH